MTPKRLAFLLLELLLLALVVVAIVVANHRYQQMASQLEMSQARLAEVLSTQDQARRFDFDRGIFAFCAAVYRDADTCNQAVAMSHQYHVYSDPSYTDGFAPSQ